MWNCLKQAPLRQNMILFIQMPWLLRFIILNSWNFKLQKSWSIQVSIYSWFAVKRFSCTYPKPDLRRSPNPDDFSSISCSSGLLGSNITLINCFSNGWSCVGPRALSSHIESNCFRFDLAVDRAISLSQASSTMVVTISVLMVLPTETFYLTFSKYMQYLYNNIRNDSNWSNVAQRNKCIKALPIL